MLTEDGRRRGACAGRRSRGRLGPPPQIRPARRVRLCPEAIQLIEFT
ncbi:conserved hypothetical protein [Burkholderia pseudomallei MSHR346]|nr:conserved hypothetical protein [Burkholderia pseudomallei MSHR346]